MFLSRIRSVKVQKHIFFNQLYLHYINEPKVDRLTEHCIDIETGICLMLKKIIKSIIL